MDAMNDSLQFSPEELRKKYLAERDKRLRGDGNAQYIDVAGDFETYAKDPYVDVPLARHALEVEVDVVVVGGGFSGLMAAAQLRRSGVEDIRVIEQGGDFGGTWYWNRYPGIRCDIESYIYMPLLEEVGTMPTEKYAEGAEIYAHCQAIGRHYDLYSGALFQTVVTHLQWDEERARWIVETDRGDSLKARYVVAGAGPFNRPKLPGIPGIKDFKGKSFHTSRWDYEYTGGSAKGNLTKLADKRVAVIGTGATTIQIVPQLAQWAKQLYVFQRTPSAVDARNNRPTDPEWFNGLESGWQKRRTDNFLALVLGMPQDEDLVQDQWTSVAGQLWGRKSNDVDFTPEQRAEQIQMLDYQQMERIRGRVAEIVKDPETAEAMKPWYNFFCKRPLYSDDYLEAFNRSNVTLVDTQGRGVERITENALIFDGKEYEADCIIFATGFQAGALTFEAGGYEMIGREGQSLREKWKSGVRSLHGILTNGFPNLFVMGSSHQGPALANYSQKAQEQGLHVAELIAYCLNNKIKIFNIKDEAEEYWAEMMRRSAVDRSGFEEECTPGYFNNEGAKDGRQSLLSASYGGGAFEYFALCDEWRKSDFGNHVEIAYQ